VYHNHEIPVYLAARTRELALEIFYKAGNGKVIKCGWKKLQNYDIWEDIGEVRQKVLSSGLQVHDVACLGYGADELGIVRFTFYLFS
jgi:hypothetical protein